jgi:choline kinase
MESYGKTPRDDSQRDNSAARRNGADPAPESPGTGRGPSGILAALPQSMHDARSAMKAIILAAGVGERMGAAAGGRPKCLLEFDGSTLLARHVALLRANDVTDVSVVTGFGSELIASELERAGPAATILNPDFRSGSVVSLWSARAALRAGADILLMDADVLYHPRILLSLIKGPRRNCFLMDQKFESGEEPVKLCLRHGRIVEFRKQVAPELAFDTQGESIGFFRLDAVHARRLADLAARYVDENRKGEPYEEAIRELVLSEPAVFEVEDVTGLPWIELDFPADLARARGEILPRILGLPN